jgi:hypothetical protein
MMTAGVCRSRRAPRYREKKVVKFANIKAPSQWNRTFHKSRSANGCARRVNEAIE